jgi:hypothetical protein
MFICPIKSSDALVFFLFSGNNWAVLVRKCEFGLRAKPDE